MNHRIRFAPLRDKITDPATAARVIGDGTNLFISGFTTGYPKQIPRELVRRAEQGERFKINLYAGASTGDQVDGILADAGLVAWRRPYMSDRTMRKQINLGEIRFKDDHLSRLSGEVRAGHWGRCHVAVVEAVGITEKGDLIPTLSVGNTPTYVREADRIIVLDHGKITESGTHAELIQKQGLYQQIWEIQSSIDFQLEEGEIHG